MLDFGVSLGGLAVGFVVGLTGMGGGALMTPLLVLLFGVQPLAAVSSDIVASVIMKPVGGTVHWRRGTVHTGIVKWLVLGSVPSAFAGVLLLKSLDATATMQDTVKYALGLALLTVASGLLARPLLQRRRRAERPSTTLEVKPWPTLLIGVLGGLVVGITSVGSGSLIIIALLLLYPRMRLSDLVGTDLVQAVPLVASAALGHVLFGDFHLGLTASILIGSIPGVFLGAHFSARAPDHVIRPALIVVLLATSLKLLGASTTALFATAGLAALVGLGYAIAASQRLSRARMTEGLVQSDGDPAE